MSGSEQTGNSLWSAVGAALQGAVLCVVDDAGKGTAVALASGVSRQSVARISRAGGGTISLAVGRSRLRELGLSHTDGTGSTVRHFWTSTPAGTAGELACLASALANPGAKPFDFRQPGPVRTIPVSSHGLWGESPVAQVALRVADLANGAPVAFATPIAGADGEPLLGAELAAVIEREELRSYRLADLLGADHAGRAARALIECAA